MMTVVRVTDRRSPWYGQELPVEAQMLGGPRAGAVSVTVAEATSAWLDEGQFCWLAGR